MWAVWLKSVRHAATKLRAWRRLSNRWSFRHSSLMRPLNDSAKPFSHWFTQRDIVPIDLAVLLPPQDRI